MVRHSGDVSKYSRCSFQRHSTEVNTCFDLVASTLRHFGGHSAMHVGSTMSILCRAFRYACAPAMQALERLWQEVLFWACS